MGKMPTSDGGSYNLNFLKRSRCVPPAGIITYTITQFTIRQTFSEMSKPADTETTKDPYQSEVINGSATVQENNLKPGICHRISKTIKRRCRTVKKCLLRNSKYLLYLMFFWFGCVALWQMMYGGVGPGKLIFMIISAACKKIPGKVSHFLKSIRHLNLKMQL